MPLRKNTKEELLTQAEGFFDREKKLGKITENKANEILKILYQSEEIWDKDSIKNSLSGELSSEEFEQLYGEYEEYGKNNLKEMRDFIEKFKLLPDEGTPLINEFAKILVREYGSVEKINVSEDEIENARKSLKGIILALKKAIGDKKRLSPKLINIINSGEKENIEAFANAGINTIEGFLKLEDIICRENREKIIKSLGKAGIKTAEDFVKLKDIISRGRVENIELLANYGIKDAEDFVKLKDIVECGGTESIKVNIELLEKYNVNVAENFISLKDIIHRGKKGNIESFGKVGMKTADDFIKLESVINNYQADENIIEAFGKVGIKTADDFLKLKDISDYYSRKDIIEAFGKAGIKDADDFIKLKCIICDHHSRRENIGIFSKVGIKDAEDFVKLKDIICDYVYINEKNLETLVDLGIKDAEDFVKLKDIICNYQARNDIVEAFGKTGIKDAEDFVKLKDIICNSETKKDIIEALGENGIKTADDFLKLKDIICDCQAKGGVIKAFGKVGIRDADDFVKLKDIICNYNIKKENIEILGNLGIKTVEGFSEFKRFCKGDNIGLIMKKFGYVGIISSDDCLKILKYMNKENIDTVLVALDGMSKKTGEKLDETLHELLKIYKEYPSKEKDTEYKILLLNFKGFSCGDIKKYVSSGWINFISRESLEFILDKFDINTDELITLADKYNYVEKNYLETFFEKYNNMSVEQLNLLGNVIPDLKKENLEIVFNKYPNIKIEELVSLEEILKYARKENLEIIFEKYKDIEISKLKLLGSALQGDPQNLELILAKYPNIKVEELATLEEILKHSKKENLEIIFEKYKDIEISKLDSLNPVLNGEPQNLELILAKYPNIKIEELVPLKYLLKHSKKENLEIIFEKYKDIEISKLDSLNPVLNGEPQNLELILEKFPDVKIEILKNLGYIVSSSRKENLEKVFEKYKNIKISELELLKNMLSGAKKENLDLIFDYYKDIKIEDWEPLETIVKGKSENLKLILDHYKKLAIKDLKSLGNLNLNSKEENLEIILKKYPEIGLDKLRSLERILSSMSTTNWEELNRKYPNIDIETLRELEDILSENSSSTRLQGIFKKYPGISINELISIKDVLFIQSMSDFEEVENLGNIIPSRESMQILNLYNDRTKSHGEIFERIKDDTKINDNNWLDIVGLYSANEYFEDDETIPEKIKVKIREILQSDESKDFIYKKLSEHLKKSLADNEELTNEEIVLLAVLNKKGLRNMGQSESLAKFIYQINKLDKNYKFNSAFAEIKLDINKFINKHKNDANELMNPFYQISTSILEKSPAIYHRLIQLLSKLNAREQKIFYKDIFPLYNVELFLGEKGVGDELLGNKLKNNVKGQLMPMHLSIKELLSKIEKTGNLELLNNEKNRLTNNIKNLFKEKFGIKKIPTEFTDKEVESVKRHSIYLSNMNGRDKEKSAVLGYFLALKLDGKRKEFREGKTLDPYEYMEEKQAGILNEYLARRKELDRISQIEELNEEDKKRLQEEESNIMVGNTDGISNRLRTILGNINSLLDEDIYEEKEKIILKYFDKKIGKILAKQFQKMLGKQIELTKEENEILEEIGKELNVDVLNKEVISELQNTYNKLSPIVKFVNYINGKDKNGLSIMKEVENFEKDCQPTEEITEILKKIGVDLGEYGIKSTNEYIEYIEYMLKKKENKVNDDEKLKVEKFLEGIHKELDDLNEIKERLANGYEDLGQKTIENLWNGTQLQKRFNEMSPYFFTKADSENKNIISLMTNDLNMVIKNIRACLGCKDKGCNNDTDLSFGCNNRFFITTSHREGDSSFADELVTLLPSDKGFVFVMDQIYGKNGSEDILINNISVILKKLNKLNPNLKDKIGVFIPRGIGIKLSEEGIRKLERINQNLELEITENESIEVKVEEQPISDSYHEFGGIDARGTGNAEISGYLIKLR